MTVKSKALAFPPGHSTSLYFGYRTVKSKDGSVYSELAVFRKKLFVLAFALFFIYNIINLGLTYSGRNAIVYNPLLNEFSLLSLGYSSILTIVIGSLILAIFSYPFFSLLKYIYYNRKAVSRKLMIIAIVINPIFFASGAFMFQASSSVRGYEFRECVVIFVIENSPADMAGIVNGSTVISYDNMKIRNHTDLAKILENQRPGQVVNIETDKGNFSVTLGTQAAGRPFIGINAITTYCREPKKQ